LGEQYSSYITHTILTKIIILIATQWRWHS
jgi:hypothetical protein